MIRITLSLLCALLVVGCASTNITGYSDPAYASTSYTSAVVVAENAGLERASQLEGGICEEFSAAGISCRPFHSIFSPTRTHGPDSVFAELERQGVGALIVLLSGGNYSSSQNIGYQSYGSASVTGNQVQGQSSSVALTAFSRQSHMRIVVVDTGTRETAWLGDAKTEGQGAVNVTDSAFLSSLTKKVVQELSASPHFSAEK
ncbi:hypothetical protein NLU14_08500 [Marinobacter sp. 71-i]|uniref:DUF4136 domain-containing protein n=1 Tax=Marinobacter iranensis TaxID=2962607 RepID=A0ABT5Y9A9_9GAMM|nr:hypothetical protein [Marinobacter iranensis]MDF0750268.1 hypothetical protein [Marinobacter iranensis]